MPLGGYLGVGGGGLNPEAVDFVQDVPVSQAEEYHHSERSKFPYPKALKFHDQRPRCASIRRPTLGRATARDIARGDSSSTYIFGHQIHSV